MEKRVYKFPIGQGYLVLVPRYIAGFEVPVAMEIICNTYGLGAGTKFRFPRGEGLYRNEYYYMVVGYSGISLK